MQSSSLVYSEHLDVSLLSSFVYSEASMTKFGILASSRKQFDCQWVKWVDFVYWSSIYAA